MTEISQYEQQIAKLERELDDMTAALSQAWDQLVPFLQEVPDEAEAANDFEPILQAVCAAADTDYGGIYLFQAGEWVSVPENLTVADDFIGRLAVVTVPQVLVQVNPEARITWVFAPVISEHKPVGALGVGTADLDRDFTAVDIRILTRMADRIGSQVAAAQLARFREREAVRNREMQIANDIQQSVQPAMPPQNERIQIGSYWKPAKEVGGDAWGWVQADDEHLTWFILDVAGKGLPAALAAVALHTAISMALRTQLAPADVLADVNEQMYDAYTRTDLMATAAVISLNPVRGVLEVANAGHPPVLVRQGGYWQQLEATAPPIGVLPDLMAETQRLELNANDLILCYSDGFSEIQTGGSLLGHDGLLRMIPAGAKNVQALTQHIVTASKSIGVATDDQTLVTALYTREVTEDNFMEEHTTFPATLEDVSRFTARLEPQLSQFPLEMRTSVTLAVHELLVNVVEHAYAGQPGNIHFNLLQSSEVLTITIQDHAANVFNSASASIDGPDPLDLPEGGMGMFIIHQTFERVDYARTDDGNLWTLEKRIGR